MIESSINYQQVIKTITAFDNIISHNYEADISDGWKAGNILMSAFDTDNDTTFDSFIYRTVRLVLNRKNKIEINMYELDKMADPIPEKSCLFIGDVVKRDSTENKFTYNIPSDNTNIFKFDYFKNLKTLLITGVQHWPLSLHSILRLLVISNLKHITISASSKSSWLSYAWNKESKILAVKYTELGYDIQFRADKKTETIVTKKREETPNVPMNIKVLQQNGDI